jgi:lipoyl(octanoyl) transferase
MDVRIRHLGLEGYTAVWSEMKRFTADRDAGTRDELWVLEHRPVYTLGLNGDPRHLLRAGGIDLVRSDRGGQITYHGPGQLIVYTLVDLGRKKLSVRGLVSALERSVCGLLRQYGLAGDLRRDAPGVYIQECKIASLGLRVRRGCSYHGLSLNVDVDLTPFSAINPCGHEGLAVTRLADLGVPVRCRETAAPLLMHLMQELDYRGFIG